MESLHLSLSNNELEQISIIADEMQCSKQDVIRMIVFEYFRSEGWSGHPIRFTRDILKEQLKELSIRRDVNRVKFGAIFNKRKYFLPQIVGRYMSEVRKKDRSVTSEEIKVLTDSYIEEAKIYGPDTVDKVRARIEEEINAIDSLGDD